MADNYKGNNKKLVSSDYLYKVLQLEDERREGKLHDSLYHKETITVVDQEEYYNIATSGDSGALKVVLTVSDPSTEIALTDINTQTTPVDLSSLTGDGTEYVVLVPSTTHDENVEVETYRKASESYSKEEVDAKITAASTGMESMTPTEFNDYFDNLTITSSSIQTP